MSAAFSLWNDPLPAEERDEMLTKLAQAVVGRGLETPAILALEMHKPLAFLGAQSLVVATPLLGPLVGLDRMKNFSRLLNEPNGVDLLVRRIDELSAAKARAAADATPTATTTLPEEKG